MALYNINNVIQGSPGSKGHWSNFKIFSTSDEHKHLYSFIINEIANYVELYYSDKEGIDSSKLGAFIINKAKVNDYELYKQLYGTLHGGIFGMTLFNYLVNDSTDWYFLSESIDKFDDKTGSKYFKKIV